MSSIKGILQENIFFLIIVLYQKLWHTQFIWQKCLDYMQSSLPCVSLHGGYALQKILLLPECFSPSACYANISKMQTHNNSCRRSFPNSLASKSQACKRLLNPATSFPVERPLIVASPLVRGCKCVAIVTRFPQEYFSLARGYKQVWFIYMHDHPNSKL